MTEGRGAIAKENMLQRINAVGKGIDKGEMTEDAWHGGNRIHCAREEKHWHDEEVHDDVEAVK